MAAANGGEVFDVATRKAPVNTLFSLQSERVQAYNVFHDCYEQYIASGPAYNFVQYRNNVKTATACFQRISGGVRDALAELELLRTAQAALRLVTQLQDQEKNKLSQTVEWQLRHKDVVDARRIVENVRDGDDADERAELLKANNAEREAKQRLGETTQEIADTLQDLRYEFEDLLLAEET
eukprot:scpid90701/ scgid27160/ Uncharacterized protein C19orf60 homolog